MNFYKHHIGDYAAATSHLTFVEDAAFSRLLRIYYRDERPIAGDLRSVHRLTGARSKEEREAVETVLAEFFTLEDGVWRNKRADEEIAKAQAQAEANRRVAVEREARKIARTVQRSQHESFNESLNESSQSREPSQTPDARHQTRAKAESADADLLGSTVVDLRSRDSQPAQRPADACPHAEIVGLYHEILPQLRRIRDWGVDRQKFLRARWREAPERQDLAWWRGFFEYIGRSDFLMGRTVNRDGRAFDCDLEWIVRPTNFRKIVEGKYENQGAAA